MVNRKFFNYIVEHSETICDEYNKWDNPIDLDEEKLLEYIEIEHKDYGSMYIEIKEFVKLSNNWLGLSKIEQDIYLY